MKKIFAEWEKQDGILLSFPHKNSDWKPYLDEVRNTYCEIIYPILQVESCLLVCENKTSTKDYINNYFAKKGWNPKLLSRLYCVEIPSNDTWTRDFGGITITKNNQNIVLDFGFNGWGLKFASNFDNKITRELAKLGILKNIKTENLILEGGSIESNGAGILLTNTQCLLEDNRNPTYTQKQLEKKLKKTLGIQQILWLNSGYLSGDDTDSHIDTLARFVDKKTIVYVGCADKNDEHYPALLAMKKELEKLRDLKGEPFKLVELPLLAQSILIMSDFPQLMRTFYFLNGRILLPTYQDSNDNLAREILQNICPKHEVIPIDCSVLIRQHGSLHCISMQFPKKTLNFKALKNLKI